MLESNLQIMYSLRRMSNMRKTLVSLSIALAFTAGSAMADQATLDALQTAGIVMTAEQAEAVLAAQGEQIAEAVAALVAANLDMAEEITKAAVSAAPDQKDAILKAVIAVVPVAQVSAITAAANSGTTSVNLSAGSTPSSGGAGGSNTASPN